MRHFPPKYVKNGRQSATLHRCHAGRRSAKLANHRQHLNRTTLGCFSPFSGEPLVSIMIYRSALLTKTASPRRTQSSAIA